MAAEHTPLMDTAQRIRELEDALVLCRRAVSGDYSAWPEPLAGRLQKMGGTPLDWRVNRVSEIVQWAMARRLTSDLQGRDIAASSHLYRGMRE